MPRIVTLTPNPAFDYAVETPKVTANRKLRCTRPRTDPGGGGVNVSRAAKRLGAETLAIFTAGGSLGSELVRAVASERIPARVVSTGGETRLTFHVKETSTGDEYRFSLPGAPLAKEEIDALLSILAEETREGDFVVGSGSLPPHAPPYFFARAARTAKDAKARFVLDTTDGNREALEEGLFLIRLNLWDLNDAFGVEASWPDGARDFARSIVASGQAEKMVVANGGEGAILVGGDNAAFAPALDVPTKSAVGAGDSFVAGLLVSFLNGESDENALRFAMACAAATITTPGTALFEAADVRRLYESGARGNVVVPFKAGQARQSP